MRLSCIDVARHSKSHSLQLAGDDHNTANKKGLRLTDSLNSSIVTLVSMVKGASHIADEGGRKVYIRQLSMLRLSRQGANKR